MAYAEGACTGSWELGAERSQHALRDAQILQQEAPNYQSMSLNLQNVYRSTDIGSDFLLESIACDPRARVASDLPHAQWGPCSGTQGRHAMSQMTGNALHIPWQA